MTTATPIGAATRIAVINVVRGFALLLIFTVPWLFFRELWRSATCLRRQPLRKREGNWVVVPEREPAMAALSGIVVEARSWTARRADHACSHS